MRATFVRTLVEIAEEDERIVLLTGDLGFTVVEPFAERFPDRFFNVGVAEQNMVGVATGLAEAGFVPFVVLDRDLRDAPVVRVRAQRPRAAPSPGEDRRRRRRARVRDERADALRARGHRGHARAARDDRARACGLPAGSVCADGDRGASPARLLQARQERDRDGAGPRRSLRGSTASSRSATAATSRSSPRARSRTRRQRPSSSCEAQGWRSRLVVAACLSPVARRQALAAALRGVPPRGHRRGALPVRRARLARLRGRRRVGPAAAASSRCGVAGLPAVGRERGVPERRARPVGERRSPRTAIDGPRPTRHGSRTPSPPDEEAQRRHRLLPGCAGDPGHVRAADGDLPRRSASTTRSSSSTTPARTTRARCSPSSPRRDPRVVVVNHTRNFGSQSAFTSGLRIATGDAAILLDGDLQDPPELIAEFHEKWLEGWDVVYGVRVRRVTTLPDADRVQGVLSPVQGHGLRLRPSRRRRLLAARPARGRRPQRAARSPTGSSAACARGSAFARRASRTSGRSDRTARRPTRSSGTSNGRGVPSSRSPTRRWT